MEIAKTSPPAVNNSRGALAVLLRQSNMQLDFFLSTLFVLARWYGDGADIDNLKLRA